MKGKRIISVSSRKAVYHLELERKISVIKGNSGTGKSSLIRLISEYLEYGKQSGVKISADSSVSFAVLTNTSDWPEILSSVHDTILFIDEDVRYLYSESFQKQLWKADCYAVIVSRSGLFTALPYSIFGIYELVTEKKGVNTTTTMYRLYKEKSDSRFPLNHFEVGGWDDKLRHKCIFLFSCRRKRSILNHKLHQVHYSHNALSIESYR